jgi:Peptidase family M23
MKNTLIIILILISNVSNSQLINRGKAPQIMCMPKGEIEAFKKEIFAKRDAVLQSRNISKAQLKVAAPQQILFSWPLQANADYDFTYNNTVISNFVDQNTTYDPAADDDLNEPQWIEDWSCGERTYDGHDAEDISNYPYPWHMYDVNATMVVAAADGEILNKRDGSYDKNCARGGSNPNYVSILHDDGTVSSYLHMKSGFVTDLPNGTRVKQGDYLGIVASSGNSTGPHLHFSIYDINDLLIDPFAGTCNILNNTTWWQNPRNYWEPQINKVMTHDVTPVAGTCWGNAHLGHTIEQMNGKNQFTAGQLVTIGTYLQDIQDNDVITGVLFTPSGATFDTWTHTTTQTSTTWWYTNTILLPAGNSGTWIVRMTYRNKNYYHFFTVGCNSSETVSSIPNGSKGYIAGTSISSIAAHNTNEMSKVLYQAGSEITFSPGFEIKAGAHLKARIKGCDFVE